MKLFKDHFRMTDTEREWKAKVDEAEEASQAFCDSFYQAIVYQIYILLFFILSQNF